jgi:hypothetical protein
MSSAGWIVTTDQEKQKLYVEFVEKNKEDSHVELYIESRYYNYEELLRMFSGQYGLTVLSESNIRAINIVVENKIKKYIVNNLNSREPGWLDNNKFNSEEIRNIKLAEIDTIEKVKELFDTKKIYVLEGFGKNLIYKLASIVDAKFGTCYSAENYKLKVDILDIISQNNNTIYKLKYIPSEGEEIIYMAEEYIVDGSYHYHFYQRSSRVPYVRTELLIDKIMEYKSNNTKINKYA